MADYTNLDFFILMKIAKSNPNESTWNIAKQWIWEDLPLSFNGDKKKEERYWVKKTDCVGRRLKRMAKYGLVKITKQSTKKNIYNVMANRVKFKRKFIFPGGEGKAICIKEKEDDKWMIFEL